MTIAAALFASLFCLCATAARKSAAPAFACNLREIASADRPRYNDLVKRIRNAIRNRTEIPAGYTFKLDSKVISLPEAAEWMGMERLCCPFLTLQLSVSGEDSHWLLSLTGPAGVKTLLEYEFQAH
jgi:hypothetical protein